MAYNKNDTEVKSFHQPGGTGIRVTGAMTQYCRKTTTDPRNLGRYCSAVFYANKCQRCRVISMYNICKGRTEGLRTQYQQIKREMQRKGIQGIEPRDLFMYDFVAQCKKWAANGDGLLMIGDVNDDAIKGELTLLLQEEGIDLEEFTQDFWSGDAPASHINGNDFIVLGMKSKNIEVTQWLLLPWISSVGDHRTWIVEVSLRSMLGPYLLRIQ